jgi:phosphinothricin acetyltransferase
MSVDLRVAQASDGAALAAIYDPVVRETAISFETEPPTAAAMAGRVAGLLPTHPWLVAETNGTVAGYAYASPHRDRAAYRWSTDVTVYVAAAARGGGLGRALYGALLAILARQRFHAAFAGVTLPNAASVGLHRAAGFEPVGVYREVGFKHGSWHDVAWFRRALEGDSAPAEPIAFAELRTQEDFAGMLQADAGLTQRARQGV